MFPLKFKLYDFLFRDATECFTVNEQEWAHDISGISVLDYVNSLNEKETDKTLKADLEKSV